MSRRLCCADCHATVVVQRERRHVLLGHVTTLSVQPIVLLVHCNKNTLLLTQLNSPKIVMSDWVGSDAHAASHPISVLIALQLEPAISCFLP